MSGGALLQAIHPSTILPPDKHHQQSLLLHSRTATRRPAWLTYGALALLAGCLVVLFGCPNTYLFFNYSNLFLWPQKAVIWPQLIEGTNTKAREFDTPEPRVH